MTSTHELIFRISTVDPEPADNVGRFVQTGVCSCGEYFESRSVVNRTQARHNLRHLFAKHLARVCSQDPEGLT